MSGGVGPTCNEISLPKEEEQEHKLHQKNKTSSDTANPKKAAFLSFGQLNCLAIMIILSASGMVSAQDFAFVLFSIIYMFFLAKFAFPVTQLPDKSRVIEKTRVFRLYVTFAAIIGLLLPIAYIIEGVIEGDKDGIRAAAPHIFLLTSQIFMEGVSVWDMFSLPIRVYVPVFYNSMRIFTIVEWLRRETSKVVDEYGGSSWRLYVGRALAVANLAFWCFNLFGFLLPVYLPKSFKKYYSGTGSKVKG